MDDSVTLNNPSLSEEETSRQQNRQSFLRDGQLAWGDFQRTELHLAGDEVNVWLAKLSAGEDAELPECRT